MRNVTIGVSGALLLALAACHADGIAGGAGAGGGGGGGGGGDCLLRDPVTNMCIIGGPGTGTPNYSCTQTAGGGVATVATSGPLCMISATVCDVTQPQNAVDGNFMTYATAQYDVGVVDPALMGSVTLNIQLPGAVPAGQVAAFLVDFPGGVVDASILRALTVSTALGATAQESGAFQTVLDLDVLGLVGPSEKILVGFSNKKPYNKLSLTVDSTLLTGDITNAVNIYEGCLNAVKK